MNDQHAAPEGVEFLEKPPGAPAVYASICAVQGDLSRVGIAKDSKNQQQGFMYRGIDAVYGAMSPLLFKYKLVILPRVTARQIVERQTKSGGALFYVTLDVDYDFVSALDGSKHTVSVVGEAMDTGDKATNKAMSVAYKYACFQAFAIPIIGDNDPDGSTHEIENNEHKANFDALMSTGDGLGLHLYTETLNEEQNTNLFNSFPDGHRSAMKEKYRSLVSNGLDHLDSITAALDNNDAGSWAELSEGMTNFTKKLLGKNLSSYQISVAKDLTASLKNRPDTRKEP